MNDFRDQVLSGKRTRDTLLRAKKAPRPEPSTAAEDKSFSALEITREEARQANHRDSDRHRLLDEAVEVVHRGRAQRVTLVNLSGGGAMIEGADGLKLWDRVDLCLADWSHVEAAVRWIRGSRLGLEFAHETRIDAPEEERNNMLRAVILRSFPHIAAYEDALSGTPQEEDPSQSEPPASAVEADEREESERELRHPLIWSGLVHYDHDSIPVRLRNISSGGAMVECSQPLKIGAVLLLDLNEGGTVFASVNWIKGDAAGLKFEQPFDLQQLAKARPELAGPRWVAPDYLRDDSNGNSPWAAQWGRMDLDRLHQSLRIGKKDIRRH